MILTVPEVVKTLRALAAALPACYTLAASADHLRRNAMQSRINRIRVSKIHNLFVGTIYPSPGD